MNKTVISQLQKAEFNVISDVLKQHLNRKPKDADFKKTLKRFPAKNINPSGSCELYYDKNLLGQLTYHFDEPGQKVTVKFEPKDNG